MKIVFTLRAVQYPASIPISLASLNLITQTTQAFTFKIFNLFEETGSISDKLSNVRKVYEVGNIPNRIPDGVTPFPEAHQLLDMGLSIEFRYISHCHSYLVFLFTVLLEMSRSNTREVIHTLCTTHHSRSSKVSFA
jgi:hypothetical protein